jgi:membrane protein DedA with SNARE-associated domain
VQGVLDWLAGLPPFALYAALAGAAAIENFFPPFPADTVVAFGSFLAARGEGSVVGSFLATWFGNVAGAMGVYALGRHYGAERLAARFGGEGAQTRVRALYARYGVWALALSRFVPGIRAVVAPLAGALRVPPSAAAFAIGAASAVWYGGITFLAYRLGEDWSALQRAITTAGRGVAVAAAVAAALAAAAWLVVRRRRAA